LNNLSCFKKLSDKNYLSVLLYIYFYWLGSAGWFFSSMWGKENDLTVGKELYIQDGLSWLVPQMGWMELIEIN
jgi:hypothetical protein